MTLTFDQGKLTTVKKFNLSILSHNKTSNKKLALQMRYRCKLKNYNELHPITTQLSLVLVILRQ